MLSLLPLVPKFGTSHLDFAPAAVTVFLNFISMWFLARDLESPKLMTVTEEPEFDWDGHGGREMTL